tara:strand:- start:1164 stop:3134 length:1971 start_codon:yes stop_codon:yes gene_type:complete
MELKYTKYINKTCLFPYMQYSHLVELYEKLDSTSKRLNKTYYIAEFLKKTKTEDLDIIMLLLQGKVFPSYDQTKIGVSSKLVAKALNIATGITQDKIIKEWKKLGGIGNVAESLTKKKKQATLFSTNLTIKKVFNNIKKLSTITGTGSQDIKLKLISELLTSAKPDEAKYIVRTITEEMRIGVGEGSLRDAIVWAFFPPVEKVFFYCEHCKQFVPKTKNCLSCDKELNIKEKYEHKKLSVLKINDPKQLNKNNLSKYELIQAPDEKIAREIYNSLTEKVQHAIDLTNDLAIVTKLAKEKGINGLKNLSLTPGNPVKVMLFPKALDLEDAFDKLGKPCAFEYKYDGFRLLVHRNKDKIILFTRRLENVTKQFPDIVEIIKTNVKSKDFIIDGEVLGIDPKTKKYLPFQKISQRIKRKHNIDEIIKKVPVTFHVFDILELNRKSLLTEDFEKRRKHIEHIVKPTKHKINIAKQLITSDLKKAQAFYDEALKVGEEGVMAKKLDAPYKPGARVGYGMKVKPVMKELDLVIVGAIWGEGKRSKWLASFILACQDKDGNILEIGKVGTGIKEKKEVDEDVTFEELTQLLKPLIISEKGKSVKVKPEIIVELNYEEIQKSTTYSSGYALRFPRIMMLRHDKPISEIATLKEVNGLYEFQKGR